MKAAVHTRYGPPEVVRVIDVPAPVPGEHELLVRVHATTVNRTDCGFRSARPFFTRAFTGLRRPRQTIMGCEFAGEVVQTGASVSAFSVGQRVLGYVEGRDRTTPSPSSAPPASGPARRFSCTEPPGRSARPRYSC
ncbi:MAG: alcohol dehydrogenase catalytic domain-containing protein [Ornithinimicrobium sp.]|uniref:alcohol dehydrogenase catalytic domain-containing protein n=1 Tax=Ornithinimicrobium sp. TaxID=1977084 RepID=UPI003D9B1C30